MGQAKRRRAELGALYGTPEGSNRAPVIEFRDMTADEIEALDPEKVTHLERDWGRPLRCVMACRAGETVPLLAAPVIDGAGQFNSYAVAPLQQLNLKLPPAVLGHWRAQASAQGLSVRDWLVSITAPQAAPQAGHAAAPALADRVAQLEALTAELAQTVAQLQAWRM
jgi:hypothetical protein